MIIGSPLLLIVFVVLLLLGGVTAAILLPLNARRRAATLGIVRAAPAGSNPSSRLITSVVLFGVGLVGVIAGIALGNATGPGTFGYSCPSVFQWNGLSSDYQGLVDGLGGGDCSAHVARMTVAMVVAFLLAVAAVAVATVLLVRAQSARPQVAVGSPASAPTPAATPVAAASPPAWHPIPGRPGMLRWWDGTAWTDHIHDQNAPQ